MTLERVPTNSTTVWCSLQDYEVPSPDGSNVFLEAGGMQETSDRKDAKDFHVFVRSTQRLAHCPPQAPRKLPTYCRGCPASLARFCRTSLFDTTLIPIRFGPLLSLNVNGPSIAPNATPIALRFDLQSEGLSSASYITLAS